MSLKHTMCKALTLLGAVWSVIALQSCTGILSSVYDEPDEEQRRSVAGQLYLDASDWTEWHYIDVPALTEALAADPEYDVDSAWNTYSIPMEETPNDNHEWGIYTYWYDVFGAGISVYEFRSFYPTAAQPEPDNWTIAIHRNNVRTNGCKVAATNFKSFDEIPADKTFLNALIFEADEWSETDVWCEQSQMLLGLIGNQGININPVLSSWLKVDIPPIPPAFTLNSNVFVLQLPDNTYAALQLENYQSSTGTKCVLTINYKYPL